MGVRIAFCFAPFLSGPFLDPGLSCWQACQKNNHVPELFVYDEIVSPAERKVWGVGVDAELFAAQLRAAGDGDLHVRFNSPGGSAWEGMAMHTLLMAERGKGRKVIAHIDGACLSAATLPAAAADEVRAGAACEYMIHNPSLFAYGDADDMRKAAERLDTTKAAALAAYRQKTGHSDDTLAALMTAETWLTPGKAKELRFVDVVEAAPAAGGDGAQMAAAPWRSRPELRHPAARAAYERMQARPASVPPPAATTSSSKGPDMNTNTDPPVELVEKAKLDTAQMRVSELEKQVAALSAPSPVLAAVKALTGKESAAEQIAELAVLGTRLASLPSAEEQQATERASLVQQLRGRNVPPVVVKALEAVCDSVGDLAALRAAVSDPRVKGLETRQPAPPQNSDPSASAPGAAAVTLDDDDRAYAAERGIPEAQMLERKRAGIEAQNSKQGRA